MKIRRPHWRRACGTIGQLDMKLKVKSQVNDTIISLACLSQVNVRFGKVGLGWVSVPPAPSLGCDFHGFSLIVNDFQEPGKGLEGLEPNLTQPNPTLTEPKGGVRTQIGSVVGVAVGALIAQFYRTGFWIKLRTLRFYFVFFFMSKSSVHIAPACRNDRF